MPKFVGLLYVNDSGCSNLQYGGLFICYFKIVMTLHICYLRSWRPISEIRHLLLTVFSAQKKPHNSQQPPQTYVYWRNNFLYIHIYVPNTQYPNTQFLLLRLLLIYIYLLVRQLTLLFPLTALPIPNSSFYGYCWYSLFCCFFLCLENAPNPPLTYC